VSQRGDVTPACRCERALQASFAIRHDTIQAFYLRFKADGSQRNLPRMEPKEEQKNKEEKLKLECGPVPNVMAALPNIAGALCSTPQSLAGAHCSNAVQ